MTGLPFLFVSIDAPIPSFIPMSCLIPRSTSLFRRIDQ